MRIKDDKKVDQIFDGALELVEQSGIAGINMCDISKAAGIATGTLYIYFKNKEELINELFTVCRKESAGFYFQDYNNEDCFKTGFQKIFNNIISYRLSHFRKSVFLEQYFHSPYVNDKQRKESCKRLQPFFDLMAKGRTKGIIKEADDLLLLWFVMGSINEMIRGSHYRKRPVKDEMVSMLFNMCWDGIKNSKARD